MTVPGSPIKPTEAGEYRIEFQIQRRLDGEDDSIQAAGPTRHEPPASS